jgi:hypothetical protein
VTPTTSFVGHLVQALIVLYKMNNHINYSDQITVDLANHVALQVGWMHQADMVFQQLLLSNGKSCTILETTHDQHNRERHRNCLLCCPVDSFPKLYGKDFPNVRVRD